MTVTGRSSYRGGGKLSLEISQRVCRHACDSSSSRVSSIWGRHEAGIVEICWGHGSDGQGLLRVIVAGLLADETGEATHCS